MSRRAPFHKAHQKNILGRGLLIDWFYDLTVSVLHHGVSQVHDAEFRKLSAFQSCSSKLVSQGILQFLNFHPSPNVIYDVLAKKHRSQAIMGNQHAGMNGNS